MKIWHGYGSEHSMNLVMIGHFKSLEDAEKTKRLIDRFSEELPDMIEIDDPHDRYGEPAINLLRETDCYILGPRELEHFLYDTNVELEEDKIILTTDESEVSAYFKLMIKNGAKVEIFSAHNYPESEYGRGS